MSKKSVSAGPKWRESQSSMTTAQLAMRQTIVRHPWRAGTAAGIGLAAVTGLLAWALWPEQPRQREYLDATACLLTDNNGLTTAPADSVWPTMQDISATTLVRVQHQRTDGPQTTENATTHLATLAYTGCQTIVATGKAPIDAVTARAGSYPKVTFITVGSGTPAANVQVVDATGDAVRSAITDQLTALAEDAS
ncbi:hypothetical protein [Actinoplanes italicus]|nr:hypothetical protein [Actinoplanes italicus]